ncbi:MAG: response regulator [Treponema sp.]|jgi:putative two-component system response regulator|nr:response regulator [Treponema sp.]
MDDRKTIMIVDDSIANLKIGKNALMSFYNVFTVPSAKKMFELLERNKPALILLDIDMPDMDGYEAIKLLKENPDTLKIPVIFLTGKSEIEDEVKGLTLGAIDYISKPFSPFILRKRVEAHILVNSQQEVLEKQQKELQDFNDNLQNLVAEKTKTVVELQNAVLKTMADIVDCRDDVTGGHNERVQAYLKILVESLIERKLYEDITQYWDVGLLLLSSQLHDIGKIGISDSVLQKKDALNEEEYEIMKRHTTLGVRVIEKIEAKSSACDFLEYAKIFAGTHHERWDGAGYPHGLSGESIPLLGRLLAIADVYDAITSQRPYKKALAHDKAVKLIIAEKGSHFAPDLIDLFEEAASKFAATQNDFAIAFSLSGGGGGVRAPLAGLVR